MESISIKDIIEYMDSGRPFSLSYVTCDRKRGTGGSLVHVKSAIKTGHYTKEGAILTPAAIKKSQENKPSKNPNHFGNFTRNIVLKDRSVRTVHIDLITRFNNKKVL